MQLVILSSLFVFFDFCSLNKIVALKNCPQLCSNDLIAIDPFIGEWISFGNDLTISKMNNVYKLKFYNKNSKSRDIYNGSKVGKLISYRDKEGIGRQIEIFIPQKPNGQDDYQHITYIRLMISGDDDYYKKLNSSDSHRIKGFAGSWKMSKENSDGYYEIITIDSTSKGILVNWKFLPTQEETSYARFNQNILNVPMTAVDGGINFTYFNDCDCITAVNNKYYRYNEYDEKYLGRWVNEVGGEITVTKNGDYYLVTNEGDMDFKDSFLAEIKNGNLSQLYDKYSPDATYTTIKHESPGVISWEEFGHILKYTRAKN